MKLRIGETVLCKKPLLAYYADIITGNGVFVVGKEYKVSSIQMATPYNVPYATPPFYYINEGGFYFPEESRNNSWGASHIQQFSNYFYTKKEMRKLKINKIKWVGKQQKQ